MAAPEPVAAPPAFPSFAYEQPASPVEPEATEPEPFGAEPFEAEPFEPQSVEPEPFQPEPFFQPEQPAERRAADAADAAMDAEAESRRPLSDDELMRSLSETAESGSTLAAIEALEAELRLREQAATAEPQPFAAEPFTPEPFTPEPFPGEPFTAEPYPAEPYPAEPYPAEPYPRSRSPRSRSSPSRSSRNRSSPSPLPPSRRPVRCPNRGRWIRRRPIGLRPPTTRFRQPSMLRFRRPSHRMRTISRRNLPRPCPNPRSSMPNSRGTFRPWSWFLRPSSNLRSRRLRSRRLTSGTDAWT